MVLSSTSNSYHFYSFDYEGLIQYGGPFGAVTTDGLFLCHSLIITGGSAHDRGSLNYHDSLADGTVFVFVGGFVSDKYSVKRYGIFDWEFVESSAWYTRSSQHLTYHTHQIRNNVWHPQYHVGSSDASTKWFGPNSEGIFITLVPGSYDSIHDGGSQLL